MPSPNTNKAHIPRGRRIEQYESYCVALFLCAGLALRCALASVAPLTGDEGFFYHIGNQITPLETWRQTFITSHPPLFFFVVRYWERLGSSLLFLRFLPAALGVLATFMMYKWIGALQSQSASLFALVFGSFAPYPLGLSVELRQYTLLLSFVFSALYFFERRRNWATALCCAGGILTHYSAIFLLPYLLLLLLARQFLVRRVDWRSISRACVPLMLPLGLFAVMYFRYIRRFPPAMVSAAKDFWMTAGYFHPGTESVGSFVATHIYAVMEDQYTYLSWPRLALIGLALVFGFRRRMTRDFAIQLTRYGGAALAMLLLVAGLAVLRVYPLSPTRHSSILFACTIPVACLVVGELCRNRFSWSLGVSIVVTACAFWSGRTFDPLWHSSVRKADMASMVALVRSVAGGNGAVVFSDSSTAVLLNYYLEPGRSSADCGSFPAWRFRDYEWGGVHVVASAEMVWRSPESFAQDIAALAKERGPGHGVYVVNAGFSKPLAPAPQVREQPVKWLMGNPGKPEVFWLPLDGARVSRAPE